MNFLDEMYNTRISDDTPFGRHWCGPDRLSQEWTLVARYEKEEGSDGQPVEVYCCAWPARFYRIDALESTISTGELRPGFSLSTGSGMADLAAAIALAASEGMLGVPGEEDQ